ncbi:MAG: AAA family ATPase [Pseudomonadota bacterium]
MTNKTEIENELLKDPFNVDLREQYAALLLAGNDTEAALAQYELVLKAEPSRVGGVIGLAKCAERSGDSELALDRYRQARTMDGFEPDDELEALWHRAQSSTPQLSVVNGGNNVMELSAAREPTVTFADIAGMDGLKKVLRLQIIEPFRNPGLFQRFRKKAGGGVLLYGPPGCGKTLTARAIAGEVSAEFRAVGISDVLNMWIGESEKNLADIFEQARARRPCVLFFDELDALAYSRSKASSSAARTVVNEFLAQLDGFNDDNEGVLILAATNMPWDVDPAMKRPGRFSRQVFVPPPDQAARAEMLRMKLDDVPTSEIDAEAIASRTELYSGADIDGLLDLAKDEALADILDSGEQRDLTMNDLIAALDQVTPSTVDWIKTARNLVKFSGADSSYKDVEKYLKTVKRY